MKIETNDKNEHFLVDEKSGAKTAVPSDIYADAAKMLEVAPFLRDMESKYRDFVPTHVVNAPGNEYKAGLLSDAMHKGEFRTLEKIVSVLMETAR